MHTEEKKQPQDKKQEDRPMTQYEIDQMFKRAEEKRLEALWLFYHSKRRN